MTSDLSSTFRHLSTSSFFQSKYSLHFFEAQTSAWRVGFYHPDTLPVKILISMISDLPPDDHTSRTYHHGLMRRNRRSAIQAWLNNLLMLGEKKPDHDINMDTPVSQQPWFTLLRATMFRKRFFLIGVISTLAIWKLILSPFSPVVSMSHPF